MQPPIDRDHALDAKFLETAVELADRGIEQRTVVAVVLPHVDVADVHRDVPREERTPHDGPTRRERGAQRHSFAALGAKMLRGDREERDEMQRGHGPQHDEVVRAADLPGGRDGDGEERRCGGEKGEESPRRRPWPPPREEDDRRGELHEQEDVERARDRHLRAEHPLNDGHAAEGRGIEVPHLRGCCASVSVSASPRMSSCAARRTSVIVPQTSSASVMPAISGCHGRPARRRNSARRPHTTAAAAVHAAITQRKLSLSRKPTRNAAHRTISQRLVPVATSATARSAPGRA